MLFWINNEVLTQKQGSRTLLECNGKVLIHKNLSNLCWEKSQIPVQCISIKVNKKCKHFLQEIYKVVWFLLPRSRKFVKKPKRKTRRRRRRSRRRGGRRTTRNQLVRVPPVATTTSTTTAPLRGRSGNKMAASRRIHTKPPSRTTAPLPGLS